jgi:translation initiation factor 1 (eIF-1/SUI1)
MKIVLDISEEDIERIARSLDNRFACLRSTSKAIIEIG